MMTSNTGNNNGYEIFEFSKKCQTLITNYSAKECPQLFIGILFFNKGKWSRIQLVVHYYLFLMKKTNKFFS